MQCARGQIILFYATDQQFLNHFDDLTWPPDNQASWQNLTEGGTNFEAREIFYHESTKVVAIPVARSIT